jgi:hypothetical protein
MPTTQLLLWEGVLTTAHQARRGWCSSQVAVYRPMVLFSRLSCWAPRKGFSCPGLALLILFFCARKAPSSQLVLN